MKSYKIIFLFLFFYLIPNDLLGCATCFGDPSAPATEGMNWAIITLLGVTGGVLSGVVGTIIFVAKKAKSFQQSQTEDLNLD
jgi:hypothetical protein|tara:strand:+ start:2389 stop:2634 length:246 start_codon:yes stop_codon:yes gene_type:complete